MSTNTHLRRNDKFALLVFASILLVIVLNVAKERFITPGNMWVPPVASHQSSVAALWAFSEVYVESSSKPSIAAQDGKLIVLGSNAISVKASVMALDERSGQLLWSMGYSGISMAVADSKVFVGGMTRVLALDMNNGNTIWSTFVKANALEITPQGDRLYIYGSSGGHDYLLDASSGEVVDELQQADRIESAPSLYGMQRDIISNVAVTQSFVYGLTKMVACLGLAQKLGSRNP